MPTLLRHMLTGYVHVSDSVADADRIIAVRDFLEEYRVTGLTCLSYNLMGWLHQHKRAFPSSVTLWIASEKMLCVLRSKALQIEIARKVGLPLLDSMAVESIRADDIPHAQFPLVLRPDDEARVSPLFKMVFIENENKLADFLRSRDSIDCSVIGQRFINGPNLIVHGARGHDGRHRHLAGFIVRHKLDGVSLTIEPTPVPQAVEEGCRAFVEHMDYVGIYHFELLLDPDNGTCYFLEINGRLGGTTGKVFASGYDEPSHLVEAYCDQMTGSSSVNSPPVRQSVYTNKRSLCRAMLVALQGNGTIFDYPGAGSRWSLFALLAGFLRWRDEIFAPGYFRSATAYTKHAFVSKLDERVSEHKKRQVNGAMVVVGFGKRLAQRFLRILFGEYQVFHIMARSGDVRPQEKEKSTVDISDTNNGYRFSLERDGRSVCVCQFWTAAASNRIRDFIPLQDCQAELVLLETNPEYRQQGLGAELVSAATVAMLAKGFDRLYARIWHSNKASLRTFRRAQWQYAYTMVEIYPFKTKFRFRVKLPTWVNA